MANTTKRMLSMSLKKLLSKTTLDNITIQDITDDAEVSRKTFYYHFQDIYDLLDWTLQEDARHLVANKINLDNWEESIAALFVYMQENRMLVLNAFHSLERDTLEKEVFKLLSPLLHRLFSAQEGFNQLSEADQDFIVSVYGLGITGLFLRWIGAIIMTHGDERGLKLPPMIAPYQVVVVPVAAHKEGVLEGAKAVADKLTAAGLRVKFDDRDNVTPGWKFNEWELKGVPVRVEIGPRDLAEGKVMSVRRDTFEKAPLDIEGLEGEIKAMLDAIQTNMFEIARAFRDAHTADVHNMEELGRQVDGGYAKAMWCGEQACEDEIKDRFSASSRCMPFDQTPIGETCVCCGKPAKKVIYFAKAY